MNDPGGRPWRPKPPDVAGNGVASGAFGRLGRGMILSSDRLLGMDLLWSAVFCLAAIGLLGTETCRSAPERFVAGAVAPHDLVAQADLQVPDPVLTERKRAEARGEVPDVYVHDRGRADRLVTEFSQELRADASLPSAAVDAAVGALRIALQRLVVGNKALIERAGEILIVHVPGGQEEVLRSYDAILDLDEARALVRAALSRLPGLTPADAAAAAALGARFVDANLAFDPEGTMARRDAAAAAVLPIHVRVPRGTLIAKEGEPITPEALARLEIAQRAPAPSLGLAGSVGLAVVVVMLAFFLHRYTRYHQRAFKKVRHLHALLVVATVLMLVVARAILWLASEVTDRFSPPVSDVGLYAYLIPLGGGAILIALLANGRIAMISSCFTAVLFGGLTGWDAYQMLWALLVQWAGVYAITSYRERAALLRAGLVVGGAGALAALAVEALRRTSDPGGQGLYAAGLAFVGGALGVGLLVSFALPLLEGLFKVLTDIRLLELSNVNHPLLSQLAVKAPGTYNHSMIVGTLAEEAAKAIGANSLFCRVAAFYHDIGKVRKPEYYIENQRGMNPHDRLTPSMSSLIVAAHVKDGIKLARDARLPEQIVDIIPQHHGTRLMTYFYEKARKAADPGSGPPAPEDFRYPGPKPSSREAAIFMLADGIEAAARTLEDPTPNRLREVIHKVSSAIVIDGQFDECDLTFADLEKIEQAFLRTLTSMYHHRLDYPGFEFGKRAGDLKDGRSGELRAVRAP
jgi:putative nucleotidyltransferase with HDIG domain